MRAEVLPQGELNAVTIISEYIQIADKIAARFEIPPVEQVYFPALREDPEKAAEFGVIVLADGSVDTEANVLPDTPGASQTSIGPLLEQLATEALAAHGYTAARSGTPPFRLSYQVTVRSSC